METHVSDLEIHISDDKDFFVKCNYCGNLMSLSNLLKNELDLYYRYPCDANLTEITKLISALEKQTKDLKTKLMDDETMK